MLSRVTKIRIRRFPESIRAKRRLAIDGISAAIVVSKPQSFISDIAEMSTRLESAMLRYRSSLARREDINNRTLVTRKQTTNENYY